MSRYTKANLREVEDQAARFGLSPNLEGRFATIALELRNSAMTYQRLAPNFRFPFGHRQTRQEEVYVVLGGSARVKFDDEILELGPWDALRVAPATVRCFEGGPEGVEMLAFGAPNTGPSPGADAEVVTDFWTD